MPESNSIIALPLTERGEGPCGSRYFRLGAGDGARAGLARSAGALRLHRSEYCI